MKAKAFFEMTNIELVNKLNSLKQELFNLRFKHASGQLENATQLKFVKRDIARVKTILRQRELNISVEAPKAKSTKKAK